MERARDKDAIYIYIYKKHIYIYDEDFSQLYDKCGARAARQLMLRLKACLHCALEPVSTDSGTGSARPH